MKSKILLAACICCSLWAQAKNNYADYVSTLVGTNSNFELSTGNTYPATAMPWGMNFWTPQTGHMGDGWVYNYTANRIRGFKQTHQPSPWMNDYGQFALMPTTGTPVFREDDRASFFNHKAETALPYYYQVYLADMTSTPSWCPRSVPPCSASRSPRTASRAWSLMHWTEARQ